MLAAVHPQSRSADTGTVAESAQHADTCSSQETCCSGPGAGTSLPRAGPACCAMSRAACAVPTACDSWSSWRCITAWAWASCSLRASTSSHTSCIAGHGQPALLCPALCYASAVLHAGQLKRLSHCNGCPRSACSALSPGLACQALSEGAIRLVSRRVPEQCPAHVVPSVPQQKHSPVCQSCSPHTDGPA